MRRLPAAQSSRRFGCAVDRSRPVGFSFQGRAYSGFEGDCVASALCANGVSVLSRSLKYRRLRGVHSMSGLEANTLVEVDGIPNMFADLTRLREGMVVRAQKPLRFDAFAFLNAMGGFLPAGFYYRAFFRPRGAWRLWEPLLRRIAGLGTISSRAPESYSDKVYRFCDVAVIGGGVAGIEAALAAADSGCRTILIDRETQLGASDPTFDATRVTREKNLQVMSEATATGLFSDLLLSVAQERRLHKIRARRCIVACGLYEQPAVFRNNDLPGVMLCSGASRLLRLYGVVAGERPIFFTSNDSAYALALDLIALGLPPPKILDTRTGLGATPLQRAAKRERIECFEGWHICEALENLWGGRIRAVRAQPKDKSQKPRKFSCDSLFVSVGFTPAAELLVQGGSELRYDEAQHSYRLTRLGEGLLAAGSLNGYFDIGSACADGTRIGLQAAKELGFVKRPLPPAPNRDADAGENHPFPIFPSRKGKAFVDFDEDLKIQDIEDCLRDGYEDVQLVKRYSTLGMGVSQGRHSNVNALRILSARRGVAVSQLGFPTFRPPAAAERFSLLAGRGFTPVRLTPMHDHHKQAGARMMVAGAWLRPAFYAGKDEKPDKAVRREVRMVRTGVGVVDVTTLGGIEVYGRDAGVFIDRLYSWHYARLPVGRVRYLLMTDESGIVADDGVCCRCADDHFYLTTTSGGSDAVYGSLLFWSARWEMDVTVVNATTSFAAVNLAGPGSREALSCLCRDVDLSSEGFPYMSIRRGHVAGIASRLLRVGFVGELGYEIHVPFAYGAQLWEAILGTRDRQGEAVRPFGVEAQRVLRLEKGHIIIGQDTDGLTLPHEAGLSWAFSKKKPFFLGKRAVQIQTEHGVKRQLVGFRLDHRLYPCPKECHLVIHEGAIDGRVTSAMRSPSLGQTIGLAYVGSERAKVGEPIRIRIERGFMVRGKVVSLPFYDPDNARQKM